MVDHVLALPAESAWLLLAPVVRGRKGEHLEWFEQARAQGFVRMRVDGRVYELEEIPKLNRQLKHDIEVVVDRKSVASGKSVSVSVDLGGRRLLKKKRKKKSKKR